MCTDSVKYTELCIVGTEHPYKALVLLRLERCEANVLDKPSIIPFLRV